MTSSHYSSAQPPHDDPRHGRNTVLSYRAVDSVAPQPQLRLHTTDFRYTSDTDQLATGGIATVYRELAADERRNEQIIGDVRDALERGRHCLVLTQWTGHLEHLGLQPHHMASVEERPRIAPNFRLPRQLVATR